jgi:hypothetical protein
MKKSIYYNLIIKILLFLALIVSVISCSKVVYVPVNHTEIVKEMIRDTIINYKLVPQYVYVETKDSISILETDYSTSICKLTNNGLIHQLNNKDSIKIQIQYKYIDRIKIDSVGYPVKGDTIIKTETNYTGWWYFSILLLIVIIYIILKRYVKIF